MGAPIKQWQFVSNTPDEVAAFYTAMFGWSVTAKNAIGYRQINTNSGGMGGGIWPAPAEAHSFVQLFIGVPDVEQSVAQALALGAQVIVPATTLPDGDTMAVLRDPTGMTFGLMRHA